MGAIASESEYGRLCRETLCPVRESRAPPALVRSELEEVVEDLAEEARIKGWTIVCEVTEARDMWDIQACVHWDGKEQESAIQWSSSGMGTGKESGRSMAICIPFSGAETAPSRLVGQRWPQEQRANHCCRANGGRLRCSCCRRGRVIG